MLPCPRHARSRLPRLLFWANGRNESLSPRLVLTKERLFLNSVRKRLISIPGNTNGLCETASFENRTRTPETCRRHLQQPLALVVPATRPFSAGNALGRVGTGVQTATQPNGSDANSARDRVRLPVTSTQNSLVLAQLAEVGGNTPTFSVIRRFVRGWGVEFPIPVAVAGDEANERSG